MPARGSTAVYRNYDLGVAFNADYVDQMYRANITPGWPAGQTLVIQVRSDRGESISLTNAMGKGSEIVLRREEQIWRSTLQRSSCKLTVAQSDVVRESVVRARLPAQPLEPRCRHDAVLIGEPSGPGELSKPLLNWSFVTSDFHNFADHFTLRSKLRTAPVSGSVTWLQWLTTLGPSLSAGDPWRAQGAERERRRNLEFAAFENLFDSLMVERALPSALEVAQVQFGSSTWAVLISSPEPFDWDRVTITGHRMESKWTPIDIRCLRDRDGTRALLAVVPRGLAEMWTPGPQRITGTFKRAPGGGLPILSEQGSIADEVAAIVFSV